MTIKIITSLSKRNALNSLKIMIYDASNAEKIIRQKIEINIKISNRHIKWLSTKSLIT